MIPSYKIKCTAAGWRIASDLMSELMDSRQRMLGQEAGETYSEIIGGMRFHAYRLRCGGIEVRQSMPRTTAEWAELAADGAAPLVPKEG